MLFISGESLSFVLLLISSYASKFSAATDFISSTQFLQDPESIVSNGSIFRMGFFTPSGSNNRYVGIWYDGYPNLNHVWVANRENPIKDSSGRVMISEDGNLVIMDGKNSLLWSSNVTNSGQGNVTAQLLDTGNLVLLHSSSSPSGGIVWQSFEHMSDLFLPNMKLTSNARTNSKLMLTSWKSASDPATGTFSGGVNPQGIPEVFIWNGTQPFWRSGPWNGQIFIGLPTMEPVYLNGISLQIDNKGTRSLSYSYTMAGILYYVLEPNGTLLQIYSGEENDLAGFWSSYETECDVYGKCGPFGICNAAKSPICTCPRGFNPGNLDEWDRGNWTSGCVRRATTNCGSSNSSKKDGFLRLKDMKVPAFPEWSFSYEDECARRCLGNCSCLAYAYAKGVGCMSWTGDLLDLQKFSNAGVDVLIRLPSEELSKARDVKVVLAITLSFGVIFIALCALFIWMRVKKRRATMKSQETIFSDGEETSIIYNRNTIRGNLKLQDLKFLSFEELAMATDSFSSASKLGQGGFGPVYRGKLSDGQEVAVKRLSRASGQGLKEFMNEMAVISKVQHRNLVRLLGYCAERGEKILVYEFMPNKSLDAFLFDPLKQGELDWNRRFKIIDGICRGLLYLHRDSRVIIIHRDLKASNILLDEELNPKISDFGMARIFGARGDQANTGRVVGTLGYMAPEYAMEGLFSEKSDVFSFGVLLLEIVSGRRNTSFTQEDQSCSLLGLAWKLWNEGKIMSLVDPVISDSSHQVEVLRCMHVGLLCTQEHAKDRPTALTTISMLNSEITDLPNPKKPAFTERQSTRETGSSKQSSGVRSINNITITRIEGR